MINPFDLWMTHYSVVPWVTAEDWDDYLSRVETILDDRLVKLDDNDPLRRKADTKMGEGRFLIQFGDREDSRWIRGRFQKTKIEIEVQHYKSGMDSFGRACENRLTLSVPERMTFGPDVSRLVELFHLGNQRLGAFYGYADFKSVICAKKPSTPSLDISRELLGVFWLTYFGPAYGAFFGRDRLARLPRATASPAGGITLQLAEEPGQVPGPARTTCEHEIAPESFAGSGGGPKNQGQYAMTLKQLREK